MSEEELREIVHELNLQLIDHKDDERYKMLQYRADKYWNMLMAKII